jgi:carbonic anhydrase
MDIAAAVRPLALACDSPGAQQLLGEHEVVKLSLINLRQFPWIAEREAAGRLTLHGAHFDVRTGLLALLGKDGRFATAG